MDALIGYSGFVGQQLARQHEFPAIFNSKNVGGLGDSKFDTVVCAAAPGSMFEANRVPDEDWEKVQSLIRQLRGVTTTHFVLISSIAVFADFAGQDDEGSCAFQTHLAYGKHRRQLEEFCATHFARCTIVRLPALFGPGLKKNFVFDLLNPAPTMLTRNRFDDVRAALGPKLRVMLDQLYSLNENTAMLVLDRSTLNTHPERTEFERHLSEAGYSAIQFHHPESKFQYFDVSRLWRDICLGRNSGLSVMHLATAPLGAGDIHKHLIGRRMPHSNAHIHREDMRTRHASVWGRQGPYLEEASEVMQKLAAFFAAQKAA
ncbi:NAD-dependent epimerase/dehydratase family protein [Primorskyibacter aestuariivivens]|uniref:NAD-dependent epimerase/dehydratase family protein n=1 Tax=Primorskyibacter aestuariivivens TaxID=1888912 RepID=UPI00230176FE|nr:NAD-dependent epimerase/dehydratase family protein [Primorskyibacter aestuariivivens]MDA7430284.1 NAD-dependent epimerase/dehydratase family protein [Primorskyibacter aestuariivivens]